MANKKMPPLPDDSHQRPPAEEGAAPPAPAGDLEEPLRQQRIRARRRARLMKERLGQHAPEEVLEMLVRSAAGLQGASQEISVSTDQLQGAMGEIALAAEQAGAACGESLAGVRQVLRAGRVFREEAARSLSRVAGAETLVNALEAAMAELVEEMGSAAEVGHAAREGVFAVREAGAEIGGIVAGVVDSADRINLLAFNASLEASRAGEHGAAFSIVAGEVRALATKAGRAGGLIAKVLAEVEAAVARVERDMGRSLDQDKARVAEARSVIETMRALSGDAVGIRETSTAISERADELVRVLGRTEENATVVATSADAAAVASTQASRALAEQASALTGVLEASSEIAVLTRQAREGGAEAVGLDEMGTIVDELGATIEEAAGASLQIEAAVREISREAVALARVTEENTPVVGQVRTVTEEIRRWSGDATSQVDGLSTLLTSTAQQCRSVIESVGQTAEDYFGHGTNVAILQERISRVDEILDELIGVNLLTTMLSVSGRIEGARAGEAGQAFTSVSEDIRALTDSTGENVTAVRRLASDIKTAVLTLTADLERAGFSVRGAADRTLDVERQLVSVGQDLRAVGESVTAISEAADEAAAGIVQVAQAIESISQAAEGASVATSEAAAAATQQSAAMTELANSSDEMALQMRFLRQ